MNYYYYLYCRGYDWYNTTGKKRQRYVTSIFRYIAVGVGKF